MTTARQLIIDSIIDLGQHDPEETPQDAELQFGLRVLNRLIDDWAGSNLLIPYTTSENFALAAGTASYTMGAAGTASATRAERIADSCYVKDSDGYSYPVKVIDQKRYNGIQNKILQGRPDRLFYDPVYPIGIITFYKVPDSTYTAYIESIKTLHADMILTTDLSLPARYENFIVMALRNRLAGSYGVQVTLLMLEDLDKAERRIKNLNLANRLEEMQMPAGAGGYSTQYNINSDEY